MSNELLIKSYVEGKLEIDNIGLSNEDKVKLLKRENLLSDLIHYYDSTKKLMIRFDEGRCELPQPK